MFKAMLDAIREESVGYLFNLKVEVQDNPIVEETPVDAPGQPPAPQLIIGGAKGGGAQGGGAGRGGAGRGPVTAEPPAGGAAAGRARGAAGARRGSPPGAGGAPA